MRMFRRRGYGVVIAMSALFLSGAVSSLQSYQPAPKLVIHMFLFQDVRGAGQEGAKEAEDYFISNRAEFGAVRGLLKGPENALTAAVSDALIALYHPAAVEELFFHEAVWDKKMPADDWVIGAASSFHVRLLPLPKENERSLVRVSVSKSKTKPLNEMAAAAAAALAVDIDMAKEEPRLVLFPRPEGDLYFFVWAAPGELISRLTSGPPKETIRFVQPPRALSKVQPLFPEELRRRNARGQIGLLLTIDEKGSVRRIGIEKPVHPYLNYSAVQAFLKWTFEPVLINGKPIKAMFRYTYDFNPWLSMEEETWPEESPSGATANPGSLREILIKAGAYGRKLAAEASDYVCEEAIREVQYDPLADRHWAVIAVVPSSRQDNGISGDRDENASGFENFNMDSIAGGLPVYGRPAFEHWFQYVDPRRDKRVEYLCDYQIFHKENTLQEHRTILKENGRKPGGKDQLLQDRRYSALGALFAPLRILLGNRQAKYDFHLAGEEKVHGEKACILLALPKSGYESGILQARLWIDKASSGILKCEVEGIPLDGQEDILNECAYLNIRPHFLMTYEYKTDHNGVLFPWRSEVLVAYSGIDAGGPVPRLKISMSYDKYRFFSVATEHQIKK